VPEKFVADQSKIKQINRERLGIWSSLMRIKYSGGLICSGRVRRDNLDFFFSIC
jgi:hypothetical protein